MFLFCVLISNAHRILESFINYCGEVRWDYKQRQARVEGQGQGSRGRSWFCFLSRWKIAEM